jgi:phosphoribosyl 1,2-cyclic phosphodiesterase
MAAPVVITFWGVRGSIASPGVHTAVFGGNTSCVSIEDQDRLLIFDGGTGIRKLGQHLEQRDDLHTIKGHIFLSHMHWDHIQGLPFFSPAFDEDNRFTVYGEGKYKMTLPQILKRQMQRPYFPVEMETTFQADIHFQEVEVKRAVAVPADITVTPFRLTHPNGALGYVVQLGDVRIAYVTDHEHKAGQLSPNVVEMTAQVDALIHDAQYSREQVATTKKGWGHSGWEDVLELAVQSKVKRLFLFHHDPDTTDAELNERQFIAQQTFPNTTVAREGLKVPLDRHIKSE